MFEEGSKRKAIYGADKVFDFSIGNPNIEPP
jgi:aspartate aminotransferase